MERAVLKIKKYNFWMTTFKNTMDEHFEKRKVRRRKKIEEKKNRRIKRIL